MTGLVTTGVLVLWWVLSVVALGSLVIAVYARLNPRYDMSLALDGMGVFFLALVLWSITSLVLAAS